MTLIEQLQNLYPQLVSLKDYVVKDDGNGQFIAQWNVKLPQPTADELAAATPAIPNVEVGVISAVQKRLDDFAQTRNYFGIMSACTYTASGVPKFQAEALYCVAIRDKHWATCYQILADVQAGLRPVPTVDEVLKEMPDLIWPT
jgi:hypothetical protein